MRLYFVAGYRPKVVKRCLGEFRLQPNSKTVSKPENYAPDFKGIHEEYSKYLTPRQIKHWKQALQEGTGRAEGDEGLASPQVGRPQGRPGEGDRSRQAPVHEPRRVAGDVLRVAGTLNQQLYACEC